MSVLRCFVAAIIGLLSQPSATAWDWPTWLKRSRPVETVRHHGQEQRNVRIGEFTGATGSSARASLKQGLERLHVFVLTDGPADYQITGHSTGGRVQGRLTRVADGKLLLERSYAAPGLDENLRAFTDDVVLAVTGKPGLATSRIVFVSDRSGVRQIYLLDFGSREIQQVTHHPLGATSPSLAPDGSMVAFTSYESGFPIAQVLDLGQGWQRTISDTSGTSFGSAFSPDGRRLALVMSFLGNPEIFITDLSSNTAACISDSLGVPSSPTWHPSGRLLLFTDDRGSGAQFYVAELPAGADKEARLSSWRSRHSFCADPEFSPDGRQVAFTARSRRGGSAVVLKDYPSGIERVVQTGGARHPSWSPDGRYLCYVQHGALYAHDLQTGQRQVLLTGYGSLSEPRWMR